MVVERVRSPGHQPAALFVSGLDAHECGDLFGGRWEPGRLHPASALAGESGLCERSRRRGYLVETRLPGRFYADGRNGPNGLVLRAAWPVVCEHEHNGTVLSG